MVSTTLMLKKAGIMQQIVDHVADNAGAIGSTAAGTTGAILFALGQIPVPENAPAWLVWFLVSVVPILGWMSSRIIAGLIAYHRAKAKSDRERIKLLQEDASKENDSEIPKLLESAGRSEAIADALDAVDSKKKD